MYQEESFEIDFFAEPQQNIHPLGLDDNYHQENSLFNFESTEELPPNSFVTQPQNLVQGQQMAEDSLHSRIEVENQDKEEQIQDENQDIKNIKVQKQKKIQKSYKHVKGPRKPKGQKNKYQQDLDGYWTKNLLPFAKKPHIDLIDEKMGSPFIENNKFIKQIKEKKGIAMSDFVTLYKCEELELMWKEFFENKVLHRELMLSRTLPKYRLVYVQFFHCFEKAFKTKKFEGISRILPKNSQQQSSQIYHLAQ